MSEHSYLHGNHGASFVGDNGWFVEESGCESLRDSLALCDNKNGQSQSFGIILYAIMIFHIDMNIPNKNFSIVLSQRCMLSAYCLELIYVDQVHGFTYDRKSINENEKLHRAKDVSDERYDVRNAPFKSLVSFSCQLSSLLSLHLPQTSTLTFEIKGNVGVRVTEWVEGVAPPLAAVVDHGTHDGD